MPNIQLFQRIFQPKPRRTVKRPAKPINHIYQLKGFKHLAFLKYEQNNLKHFGILSGDTIKIQRGIEWSEIDKHSLYVVLLPDATPRICAIKSEPNFYVTLHDGLGDNYQTYHRIRLELVGLVITAEVSK